MIKSLRTMAAAGALLLASVSGAFAQYYTINGQVPPMQVQQMMAQAGLPPGPYWLSQDGYWGIAGNPTPLGNIYAGQGGGDYVTQNGSGYNGGSGGAWSHGIDRSITPGGGGGFGVGSTGDGCIYTTSGWSNC